MAGPPTTGASQLPPGSTARPAHAKEYNFLDMELKYGILQVSLKIIKEKAFKKSPSIIFLFN